MIGWFRKGGMITAEFEEQESAIVRSLVEQVRQLLADREAAAPRDELVELTGIKVGPTTTPAHPVLARLLPDFHRLDTGKSNATEQNSAAALRALHEPKLLEEKAKTAGVLLDTCPVDGGEIQLTLDQAEAWLAALNDVRLALGVMLEISEDMPDELPEDDPRAGYLGVYQWLTAVQGGLIEVLSDE